MEASESLDDAILSSTLDFLEDGPWEKDTSLPGSKLHTTKADAIYSCQGAGPQFIEKKEKYRASSKSIGKKLCSDVVKKSFLQKGSLYKRQNEINRGAKVKRKYLEDRMNSTQQTRIIYTRMDKQLDVPGKKPCQSQKFHHDRTHGSRAASGVGSALPLGYSDRAHLEALKRACEEGNEKAKKILGDIKTGLEHVNSIAFLKKEQASETESQNILETITTPLIVEHTGEENLHQHHETKSINDINVHVKFGRKPGSPKPCGSVAYRSDSGTNLLAITATPRESIPLDDHRPKSFPELLVYKSADLRFSGIDSERENLVEDSPSETSPKRGRTSLASVLAWYTDFELLSEDRLLQAAEKSAWREMEKEIELAELERWLAEPEFIPRGTDMESSLRILEIKVAASFLECWVRVDSTKESAFLIAPFEPPTPTSLELSWPPKLKEWWFSEENELNRRKFLDLECVVAFKSPFVADVASTTVLTSLHVEDHKSRSRKKRWRWRKFREWYFGKDGITARRHFLEAEVQRLARSWTSQWGQWRRMEVKRANLSVITSIQISTPQKEHLLDDESEGFKSTSPSLLANLQIPMRWELAQAFLPEPIEVQKEYKFNEAWGDNIIWNNMSQEERLLEVQTAMCDRVIRSMAEAEGIIPVAVAPSIDDLVEEADDSDNFETLSFLNNSDIASRLMLWFSGHVQVRETFLNREVECAASDFIHDKSVFTLSENGDSNASSFIGRNGSDLKRRLTAVLKGKEDKIFNSVVDQALDPTISKMISEQNNDNGEDCLSYSEDENDEDGIKDSGCVERFGSFSLAHAKQYSWKARESDEEIRARILETESKVVEEGMKLENDERLSLRRLESQAAEYDLALARALFDRLVEASAEEETRQMKFLEEKSEHIMEEIHVRISKETSAARTIQDPSSRLRTLEKIEAKLQQEIRVADAQSKVSVIAQRRNSAVLRKSQRYNVDCIEAACRVAQQRVLEALREKMDQTFAEHNESRRKSTVFPVENAVAMETKRDLYDESERMLLCSGGELVIKLKEWDMPHMREERVHARREAIRSLVKAVNAAIGDDDQVKTVIEEVKTKFLQLNGPSFDKYIWDPEEEPDEADYEMDGFQTENTIENADHGPSTTWCALELKGVMNLTVARRNTNQLLNAAGISVKTRNRQPRSSGGGLESVRSSLVRSLSGKRSTLQIDNINKDATDCEASIDDFKSAYMMNRELRNKFLQTRVSKFQIYESSMRKRGELNRLGKVNIFDEEENLEVPPVSASILRRMKLFRIRRMVKKFDLDEDDRILRQAESMAQVELEQELQDLKEQEMNQLRVRLKHDLEKELLSDSWKDIRGEWNESSRQQDVESKSEDIFQNDSASEYHEANKAESKGEYGDQAINTYSNNQEEALLTSLLTEMATPNLDHFSFSNRETADDVSKLQTPRTPTNYNGNSFVFSDDVTQSNIRTASESVWKGGSGLDNGDEEWEADRERREAEEQRKHEEEKRRKFELLAMRKEEEDLRKFYIHERRQLLLAAEEAELNRLVEIAREEDRQRREHPLGLCCREVLALDRADMTREDFESHERWIEIDKKILEEKQEKERRRKESEEKLAKQEEIRWRETEQRRIREDRDRRSVLRELTDMGVEDTRAGLLRPIWEDERYRLHRLRWMESIAYKEFKPYFAQSSDSFPTPILLERQKGVLKNPAQHLPPVLLKRQLGRKQVQNPLETASHVAFQDRAIWTAEVKASATLIKSQMLVEQAQARAEDRVRVSHLKKVKNEVADRQGKIRVPFGVKGKKLKGSLREEDILTPIQRTKMVEKDLCLGGHEREIFSHQELSSRRPASPETDHVRFIDIHMPRIN